jgi:PAS domain S-box-containing protein
MAEHDAAGDGREREPQQLRQLLDRTTDAVYAIDRDWMVTYWNDRMATRTGVAAEEIVGSNLWDEFGESVPAELEANYRRAMETGEPVEFEQYLPDPFDYWVEVRAFPGEYGLSVFSRDITAEKERARELERQQFLFERAQQISDMGVWELDIRTDEVWWSEGARRVHGVDDDYTPVLEDITEFYHPDDREMLREVFWRAVETGELYEIEPRLVRQDGSVRHVNVRGEVISEDGEATLVRGVVQDVTEKKRTERELRRQNERLDEFIGVVAHDLRNPLSIAKGFTEMTQETGDLEKLDRVTTALDRIDRLVDDLLTLARSGRQPEKMESLQLAGVARDAWRNVDVGDAELVVQDGLGSVTAHSGRLLQLFENLFRNSVEHGGTDVTVEVGPLGDFGFYVADDGPGIPAADRDRVFEHGHTTKSGGTGFGLSIVADIAKVHDWTVEVTESATGGARFEFDRE